MLPTAVRLALLCLLCHAAEANLQVAAAFGDLDEMIWFLSEGADIDGLNRGVTALTAAAANGHYAVVEYLLSQGASVDKPNTNQFTALMEAARAKHIDILRLLIDNGADLEVARTNALYLADKTTENHSCASATGAQQL
ncbi:ankyrin repeat domain-containing protein 39-like [Penaeus chinensis]|uniref:ankyrin repeat domain-containing protein 39-like n=1 Tax=Penaeus chinensis TaxID=139456 RepID=UPI001FB76FC4|nr:ankyrin repeat domain-containing protein 39-like [Penaeus chinensis]